MKSIKKNQTILIVDDSWITRKFLVNFLEIKGFNILEVKNGKEAIELLKNTKPDCILMDVLMPEMDGIETLQTMKKLNIKVPTIMLSADIQPTTKSQCYRFGALSFISKPSKDFEILEKIDEALKKNS